MKRLMMTFLAVSLPFAAFANPSDPSGAPAHTMLKPKDMHWGPGPASLPPGMRAVVLSGDPGKPGISIIRARLPAGYKIPAHWHPQDELITVLSGTFSMAMGENPTAAGAQPYPAGSFLAMPARVHHFAWTKDGAVIEVAAEGPFEITYLNPADDPRKAAKPEPQ